MSSRQHRLKCYSLFIEQNMHVPLTPVGIEDPQSPLRYHVKMLMMAILRTAWEFGTSMRHRVDLLKNSCHLLCECLHLPKLFHPAKEFPFCRLLIQHLLTGCFTWMVRGKAAQVLSQPDLGSNPSSATI